MQAVALAETEWYSETGSYLVNSEDETCNPTTDAVETINDTFLQTKM